MSRSVFQSLWFLGGVALVATVGCQSAVGTWGQGVRRQFERAAEEIKEDLSVMDDDYDGLDAFGPEAAQEMRAARADMTQ